MDVNREVQAIMSQHFRSISGFASNGAKVGLHRLPIDCAAVEPTLNCLRELTRIGSRCLSFMVAKYARDILSQHIQACLSVGHDHEFLHEDITDHRFLARSEEHTSELQSLMRIPSAVFCLKKKTTKNIQ